MPSCAMPRPCMSSRSRSMTSRNLPTSRPSLASHGSIAPGDYATANPGSRGSRHSCCSMRMAGCSRARMRTRWPTRRARSPCRLAGLDPALPAALDLAEGSARRRHVGDAPEVETRVGAIGPHRSPRSASDFGVGMASSPSTRCAPLRIPRSSIGNTSGRPNRNISIISTVHRPIRGWEPARR